MKFIIAILFISFGLHSIACSCSGSGSVESALDHSEYVIYGKVLDTSYVSVIETLEPDQRDSIEQTSHSVLKYKLFLQSTFVINRKFKGDIMSDTVIVFTPSGGPSCGFHFVPNEEYVIYGSKSSISYAFMSNESNQQLQGKERKGSIWTHICTRTTHSAKSEVYAIEEHLQE
jgi:hypothetical protein